VPFSQYAKAVFKEVFKEDFKEISQEGFKEGIFAPGETGCNQVIIYFPP